MVSLATVMVVHHLIEVCVTLDLRVLPPAGLIVSVLEFGASSSLLLRGVPATVIVLWLRLLGALGEIPAMVVIIARRVVWRLITGG